MGGAGTEYRDAYVATCSRLRTACRKKTVPRAAQWYMLVSALGGEGRGGEGRGGEGRGGEGRGGEGGGDRSPTATSVKHCHRRGSQCLRQLPPVTTAPSHVPGVVGVAEDSPRLQHGLSLCKLVGIHHVDGRLDGLQPRSHVHRRSGQRGNRRILV